MNFKKLTLASLITASALFAGTYNVDTSHSNIGFKVKHLMITNVSGKFDKFSGTFDYDEKTKTLNSLTGNIEASSINTENEKRDEHLKSADFFEVTKYPNLTFKLDKISGDNAYGKLTIHGITKDVKLDFENNGSITDPWGNKRVGLSLSGKINRKDFALSWNKALETGGVVVGEKIKLDIELEGILAK
ncbi:YceI family protein [Poseidonibacter lekithochrous]|uniref:YceI family protein n=1 Tax=Poseidonibacter TaxID=2321187 RepID=UPI001C090EB2|nr:MULTISPECIES: YceI family protein [Poseidonibacter]MBU3014384.1 YceI family protein [Poseidonibacter lekithochrous]MDO6827682.1 YceI family protein [Poseidonibacter sp. 1_MG-2023]